MPAHLPSVICGSDAERAALGASPRGIQQGERFAVVGKDVAVVRQQVAGGTGEQVQIGSERPHRTGDDFTAPAKHQARDPCGIRAVFQGAAQVIECIFRLPVNARVENGESPHRFFSEHGEENPEAGDH